MKPMRVELHSHAQDDSELRDNQFFGCLKNLNETNPSDCVPNVRCPHAYTGLRACVVVVYL